MNSITPIIVAEELFYFDVRLHFANDFDVDSIVFSIHMRGPSTEFSKLILLYVERMLMLPLQLECRISHCSSGLT